MATIKDVAREAGVSIATVSRVVNNSPKAGKASIKAVRTAMKKLGYRPNVNARALVSKNSNTIGVLVSDISDPFFGALIKSVDQVAREHNKHLLIGNGYHDADSEREAIELLINSCRESLIIHAKALSAEELIGFAKEVPGLVLINRYIPEIADRCIAFDNFKGTYMATEFLINSGHQHIVYINSNHKIDDASERQAGYLQALKDYKLDCPAHYIAAADSNDQGGKSAMIELLSKNTDISAVVTYNDFMAAGALSALEESNISVPAQMSIVGFDNGLISRYVYPKLTTINYPIEMMAKQATELTLKLTKKEPYTPDTSIFSPTLVKRLSVQSI
ncbi:DNA-binding transcriptional regulator GalS [Psychromonas sp. B3M02]|uniref:substrate-binding domain-containing protein n=1 Tax=Psychromonas sp. B3M02 TaxID=2267226 RepID=UPI000DE838BA|nr:substrate-binding domain-containing protein [Psychromonas sp. B3M02]RBW46381.1 DNA-binding transcriptional regulator GalS [Psychromonas sp. B3M02]